MEHNNIKNKIKNTFETEVPDVLSKIKASPDFRVPQKNTGFSLRSLLNRRLTMTLTSVFVVVILLSIVIGRANYVVASTVTLDINPSIELELNQRDYVIGVNALNDDGEAVIERDVNYRGLTIEKALEIIIARMNELGYVVESADDANVMLITVNTNNEDVKARLQETFNDRLQQELDKYNNSHWVFDEDDFNLTDDQMQIIRNNSLLQKYSFTKVALAFRINELDSSQSLQSLAQLSVRQLYDLYIQLEDPVNLPHRDKMPGPRTYTIPFNNEEISISF